MEVSGQLHAPVAITPRKESPYAHWIGDWAGPIADLVTGNPVLETPPPQLAFTSRCPCFYTFSFYNNILYCM